MGSHTVSGTKYTDAEAKAQAEAAKLDDHGAADDNTDHDFSITKHGLVPKGTNVGDFLKDDGNWATPAGAGDVTGPGASTDNMIARHSGVGGTTLQDYTSNPPTISDTGDMTIDGDVTADNVVCAGNVDGRDVSVDGSKLDGIAALADVTGSNAPQAHKNSHDPNDGGDALDTAAPSELASVQAAAVGTSHSLARADHAHQIQASIADNHIVTIDHVTPADDDYAKFTANGLEGRNKAEMLGDINVADGADVTGSNAPQAHKDSHDPNDGGDALDTAAPNAILEVQAQATGTSHSLARADHNHAIVHDITDNSLVTVDGAANAPVDGDYAKWTANGVEGMEKSQILSDINVADGADVTGSNAPQAHKDTHDPNDGGDALDTAAPNAILEVQAQATGTSHSFSRADHDHTIVHDITDNSLVTVDGTTNAPVDNDYAKWTALGLEGMEKSQILSDLNVADGADVTGSNAPQAHKVSHQNAGGDEISVAGLSGLLADDQHVLDAEVVTAAKTVKIDDFATPDDNTDLDAVAATRHGLFAKLDKDKLDGIEASADVTDAGNVSGAGAFMVADLENPPTENESNKAPTSEWAFDHDAATDAHHAKYTDAEAVTQAKTVKLDDFTAADDNTDLDSSTTRHGLLLKLNNNAAHYLNGQGAWAAVAAPGAHKDTHDPNDGADPLDTAAAGTISPDDSAAEGTAHSVARSDHTHAITCDTAASIAGVQAAAEGSGYNFSRDDHVHGIAHSIANNALVTIDAADVADGEYARFTGDGLESRTAAEVAAAVQGSIKLDDLATPDDNTDLNATTTEHGLLLKLDNDDTHYLNGKGAWAVAGGGGSAAESLFYALAVGG